MGCIIGEEMVKARKKDWRIIAVVLMGVVVILAIGLSIYEKDVFLSPGTEEEIRLTKEKIAKSESPLPDYIPLYDLLQLNQGKLNRINQICEEFDPLFCLKKASQQNPQLREEICVELIRRINLEYKELLDERRLQEFVEGHKKDCLLGIPQFMY